MALLCPNCLFPLNLKAPKPGRYKSKCPRCSEMFQLAVPPEGAGQPTVARLAANPAATQTVAPAPRPAAARPAASAAAATETADLGSSQPGRSVGTGKAPAAAAAETMDLPPRDAKPSRPAGAPGATRPTATQPSGAPQKAATNSRVDAPTRTHTPAALQPTMDAPADDSDATADFQVNVQQSEAEPAADLPRRLGGYELVRELGRGGMGEVYLARQLSLARNVAVKTMRSRWAQDPVYVARFTKEAFAAAQLVHHNVVQIYDIAAEDGTNFFSMEFVEGGSLSQLLKQTGKLDVQLAVGYILQAARGLAIAHEQGMVHRDIKPDNLLLNTHGIVKLADLGIVKSPGGVREEETAGSAAAGAKSAAGANVTQAGVGIGTPAFMAPEQARDAANVDGRADIYSLGCTLYVLVTGRPPFEGRTALEVITKHATEPVVPPETVVKRVPKAVSDIILKMVAKRPEDRFQSMQEVIVALERFLGVDSTGPFSPREEHARQLEEASDAFNGVPLARLRPRLMQALSGFLLLAALVALPFSWSWAGALLGLLVLTPLAHRVVRGVLARDYLFGKVRAVVFGSRITDWLTWLAAGAVGVAVLYFLDLLWVWLAVAVVAALLAAGYFWFVDRQLAKSRREPLEKAEQLFKRLRLLGVEEESLRQFACRYSGKHWEEFYEALFGYEAKIAARERWGKRENGEPRPTFAAWRDPLVRALDARIAAREEARQRNHLVAVEQQGLEASGIDAAEARRQAEESASAMIKAAQATSERLAERLHQVPTVGTLGKRRSTRQSKFYNYVDGTAEEKPRRFGWLLSGKLRLASGAVLLVASLAWMHQNDMLPSSKVKQLAEQAAKARNLDDLKNLKSAAEGLEGDAADLKNVDLNSVQAELHRRRQPLTVPLVPVFLTAPLGNFFALAAGLLLMVSAMLSGRLSFVLVLIAGLLFAAQWALAFLPGL